MSKAKWTAVNSSEIIEVVKSGPHKWGTFKSRFLPWPYCKNCGLWNIGNAPCRKLAGKPCPPDGW